MYPLHPLQYPIRDTSAHASSFSHLVVVYASCSIARASGFWKVKSLIMRCFPHFQCSIAHVHINLFQHLFSEKICGRVVVIVSVPEI